MDRAQMWSLLRQAHAIEKDAFYSSKGHYRAAARYDNMSFFLGCVTIVLSSASGLIQAFQTRSLPATNLEIFSTVLSFLVAAITAVVTFAKLNDKASAHRSSGVRFGRLRDHVRAFYQTSLPFLSETESARQQVSDWIDEKTELNEDSLHIPGWAYRAAKKERPVEDFESGQAGTD